MAQLCSTLEQDFGARIQQRTSDYVWAVLEKQAGRPGNNTNTTNNNISNNNTLDLEFVFATNDNTVRSIAGGCDGMGHLALTECHS